MKNAMAREANSLLLKPIFLIPDPLSNCAVIEYTDMISYRMVTVLGLPCSQRCCQLDSSGNCKWCILQDHLPFHQTSLCFLPYLGNKRKTMFFVNLKEQEVNIFSKIKYVSIKKNKNNNVIN